MGLGLVGVALLLFSSLEVRWVAPPDCPAPDWSANANSQGRAEAVLLQSGPDWVLTLRFFEPFQATRHLELPSCSAAKSAAQALVLLALRDFRLEETAQPPTAPPLTEATVRAPAPQADAPPGPLRLSLGGLASAGMLPSVTPRFILRAGLHRGALEVAVSARLGLPASFPGGPVEGSAVRIWPTLGGELAFCWAPGFGRLQVGLCADAIAEWWQLEGIGVTTPRSGSAALLGLGLQARLGLELVPHLALGLFVAGRVQARRPTATFDGSPALTAGPFGLEAGAYVTVSP